MLRPEPVAQRRVFRGRLRNFGGRPGPSLIVGGNDFLSRQSVDRLILIVRPNLLKNGHVCIIAARVPLRRSTSLRVMFVSGAGSVKLETTNVGLVGEVGDDVHRAHGFSLTPYADFLFAAGADTKVNGASTGVNLGANLIHDALAASWRCERFV